MKASRWLALIAAAVINALGVLVFVGASNTANAASPATRFSHNVSAPIGVLVDALPLYYTTVVLDGVPYYYANDTYYVWNDPKQEYQVVASPAGIESAGSGRPAPDGQLFVYPNNSVSPEQQASDRYQCDTSAAEETGFDPTKADGGVPADKEAAKRADYFRAEAACLAGRGYRVR